MRRNNPDTVHPPLGGYSHTVRVPADSDLLFLAGQVGVDGDGNVMSGAREQTRQALDNIAACLAAEGMTFADIVRLTVYLTDSKDIGEMREARQAVFDATQLPTSTLLIVNGLAQPDLLVEIDVVAARARSA